MTDRPRFNATADLLERNAVADRKDRPYLICDTGVVTYGEVIARANGVGAGLLGLGLAPGDRVLLLAQDSVELVCTFWGAMKAGLVPVPMSTAISATDLRFLVEDSGAAALVYDSTCERIVATVPPGRLVRLAIDDTSVQGARRWRDVFSDHERLERVTTCESDPAFWLYTSGTTGEPKAAIHVHGSLRAAPAGLSAQVIDMQPSDVVLSASRMFFAYGLGNAVYLPAAAGAATVVSNFPVSASGVQGLIERHRPTLLFGVASFFAGYAQLAEADLGESVRMALSAGEALPADLFERFRTRFGRPLLDGLGCTEAMHHVTSSRPDDAVPGSAGRPLAGFDVEARDRDGQRLGEGQSGELWLRGPTLFRGYWRRPELTARVLVDGWLRTGDVVQIRDGRLFHEGRLDDLMKLGGIWVAPKEIEEVLRAHPDVEDAAVAVVASQSAIPALKAFLQTTRSDAGLHRELTATCRSQLASFKVPRFFESVSELPRTATGKLRRAQLRRANAAPPAIEPGMVLVIFEPGVAPDGPAVAQLQDLAARQPGVRTEVHAHGVTEMYVMGATAALQRKQLEAVPGVKRVVTLSERYRILGQRGQPASFSYNGITFGQSSFHVFAGLCAVDTREHVEATMKALQSMGLVTTRMGAYKPRTSPYDFQGLERECLPYVFELAGKYGIRVIAMEVMHERHLDEIREALEHTGSPTGVMLQIGARNAQNFELLKQVGMQSDFPILYKRGMGVTLEESLSACEYIAASGNANVIFCLRGVKTHLGDPHRNLVDFAHVPVVKRLTRMPVCVDPSHSVGKRDRGEDGLLELFHATAQGVIVGANMVLVDVHPAPEKALCDGPQALLLEELPTFLEDVGIAREAYQRRVTQGARRAP